MLAGNSPCIYGIDDSAPDFPSDPVKTVQDYYLQRAKEEGYKELTWRSGKVVRQGLVVDDFPHVLVYDR